MKYSRRELTAKRNADLYSDFQDMFNNKGMRPDAIFDVLINKYYLTNGTMYRIVLKQSGLIDSGGEDEPD